MHILYMQKYYKIKITDKELVTYICGILVLL